jgi:hypothetical protein
MKINQINNKKILAKLLIKLKLHIPDNLRETQICILQQIIRGSQLINLRNTNNHFLVIFTKILISIKEDNPEKGLINCLKVRISSI